MRISYWSSDVCSSDLAVSGIAVPVTVAVVPGIAVPVTVAAVPGIAVPVTVAIVPGFAVSFTFPEFREFAVSFTISAVRRLSFLIMPWYACHPGGSSFTSHTSRREGMRTLLNHVHTCYI